MTPQPQDEHNVHSERIEPIMYLLFAAIIFFVLLLIAISKWSPNDGQTFQVISGLLTGFSGSFLTRLKLPEKRQSSTTASATTAGGGTATVEEKP